MDASATQNQNSPLNLQVMFWNRSHAQQILFTILARKFSVSSAVLKWNCYWLHNKEAFLNSSGCDCFSSMAKAACASLNTVVSTLLPLDHMPKKQEGQYLGVVTSQGSIKCCLRILPKVLFYHSHTQTNWISYWGDFMRCLSSFVSWQVPEVTSIPHSSSYSTVLGPVFFLSDFPLTDYS